MYEHIRRVYSVVIVCSHFISRYAFVGVNACAMKGIESRDGMAEGAEVRLVFCVINL